MNNIWTVVIIGIYTLVYVVVFIIQKAKMDKQDAIISSMKAYMEIFDIDKVKQFVVMNEETQTMKFKKIMDDDENFRRITAEVVGNKSDELRKYYADEFGEKFSELSNFAFMVATKQEKENLEKFVKDFLPLNKDFIIYLTKEYYKSNP